ncbi:MAG: 8-hydroxy-5-deazaflavin:NADPH oxidoreductase [Actinomycetota bacterium]|nr:8-hydroxy-5-deazaflavin:NADPH oxidoreductase [Actinomycetota bacterium]
MTTVGIIGSGQIGSTIARLAIEAGHQVVLSNSRGPKTLADTAAELGPRASAATSGRAAAAGDIVVVAVPVKAFPNLPAAALAGKTIIDTCNYGPERDGHISELDSNSLTSSELLLQYIPDAMLVKAFNNIFFKHLLSLARPAGAADRSYLPIAGDSAPAKAAVTEFIDSIGYSVVDAGPLADSWRQATGTPVWGTTYGPYTNDKGQPAGEDAIGAAWPPQRANRKLERHRHAHRQARPQLPRRDRLGRHPDLATHHLDQHDLADARLVGLGQCARDGSLADAEHSGDVLQTLARRPRCLGLCELLRRHLDGRPPTRPCDRACARLLARLGVVPCGLGRAPRRSWIGSWLFVTNHPVATFIADGLS